MENFGCLQEIKRGQNPSSFEKEAVIFKRLGSYKICCFGEGNLVDFTRSRYYVIKSELDIKSPVSFPKELPTLSHLFSSRYSFVKFIPIREILKGGIYY